MKAPLDPPAGLHGDDTAYAAAGRWADGSNVRFRLGRAETIGGWERLTAEPLSGVCRSIFPWTDNAGALDVAFGTHDHLQVWRGGELFDVTPETAFSPGAVDGAGSAGYGTGGYGVGGYGLASADDYFPLTWSFAAWGQHLLASPRGQTIFAWTNDTATAAAPLANAPANVTHMVVAPLGGGYQVFALGCNEEVSGAFTRSASGTRPFATTPSGARRRAARPRESTS